MEVDKLIRRAKTPLNFVNSTMLLHLASLITSIVSYRYITPEYMGIWATFTTFTTLAPILRLGIPNGMNRELPYYLGKGEKDKAYQFASTTLVYSIFNIVVLGIACLCFLVFYDFSKHGTLSSAYLKAFLVFLFTVVIEPYTTYLSGTFRTSDNFNILSRNQYIMSVLNLISIPLIIFYKYDGYLIKVFVLSLSNLLLLHIFRPIPKLKLSFSMECFRKLFSVGFPLYLSGYIISIVDSLPRLLIISKGTSTQLGVFSPIVVCLSIVLLIPNTISSYLYPKFSFSWGANHNINYIWNRMKLVLLLSCGIGLVLALGVDIFIDKIIVFFPHYTDSVEYIKIICFAMAFLGQALMNVVCVVLKAWKWLWVNTIAKAIIQVVSLGILYFVLDDLIAVATWSICVTYILMFGVSFWIMYYITHKVKYEKYGTVS